MAWNILRAEGSVEECYASKLPGHTEKLSNAAEFENKTK